MRQRRSSHENDGATIATPTPEATATPVAETIATPEATATPAEEPEADAGATAEANT